MPAPGIVDHISELAPLLKTVYGDSIKEQQNLTPMLYKKFGDADVRFGGNCYEFPARMASAQSIGARPYRASLPVPLLDNIVTARVRHKFIYGTLDITGPDIEKGKGNVDSFVNVLTDKVKSLTDMILKDLNWQTYLDGTGVRCTVTGGSGNDIQVSSVKYLRAGMHVNLVDATDGSTLIVDSGNSGDTDPGDSGVYQNRRYTILTINATNRTIQLAGAAGTPIAYTAFTGGTPGLAVGDFIVRHKSVGSELTGLGAIVDDGVWNPAANVLQDIDRTANPAWRARVIDLNNTDLDLEDMNVAMDLPEILSGKRVDMIVGSYAARDRYLNRLVANKRFVDAKTMDGGYLSLEYNGREFLVDVDCPDDTIFFLNKDSIKKFGLFDLKPVDQGGGVLKHASLESGDVFYMFLRAICNLGTVQANTCAKIVEIATRAEYAV